ncbi:uncharacterized protein LOC124271309 [Haliotis rubra]|uniref:uncharacterized protein LOC124271309 n=1 Tax=Haliotis rubra TaxID=36100 RepID=UPI001EE635B7|nr:uncharacterized protein LOC124271309 [Haliotis rubra]XP_046562360.1 uncharacterized protein LOC124271309 [Haliotis rubra]
MRIAMICSCGKRSLETPPILDVERILQDYAWKDFKEKSGPVEKIFLRRRDFDVEVPMNYFHFEDSDTILKTKDSKPKTKAAAGQSIPETSVLQTQFRNNTNKSQTYKFRIERTRKATISVTFQRGFSIGGKAQFKLGLPKMMSQGGDVDMRLQISKTTGETFDETLTFEANSDINVEENCNYTANVAFTEKEISAEFMVQTLMRMPTGTAPVYIRRKRDHELYATVFINDLKDVFADYKASAEIIDESAKDAKVARYAIKFTTTGIVEGMRLSGQKIYLDSKKLDKGDKSGMEVPVASQSASAMIAGVGAAHHSGLFRANFPSDSDDAKEDSTDGASVPTYRSINNGQSETRILKAPQIPTIITTAPSSQETSPPSDAGTNTSMETQSLPEDKNEDVFDKTTPCSSATPSPKPSPGKLPSKDTHKETGKVPLKETKSSSRGSKDETKVPTHEVKSPTQAPKPKVVKEDSFGKHKMVKEDSLTKADATKLKAEPQRVKQEPQKVKDVPKVKPDPSKVQNIKILTKQTSNPKESTDAPEKQKDEKSKEEKSKDEKPKEEKTKDDKSKDEKPKDEKVVLRRSFKHETLERMERVSSLSEKPRILPKSGSLPRASVHSIEPQSSEEDSTSSLSKLSKCTSV